MLLRRILNVNMELFLFLFSKHQKMIEVTEEGNVPDQHQKMIEVTEEDNVPDQH